MGGDFTAYGASHVIALAVTAAGVAPAVWLGRQRSVTPALGWAMLVLVVPLQLYDALPGRFALGRTLPLQLSDLAWIAAIVALLTGRRRAATLTYYWGLTVTVQAVLTPSLVEDAPDPRFWAFWTAHTLVVWAAAHLVWGRGLRPGWRDYRWVVLATGGWLVGVLAVNPVLGTNYGYVTRKPPAASVLDYLGPWPVYLLAEIAILAAVWALLTWPWVRRRPS